MYGLALSADSVFLASSSKSFDVDSVGGGEGGEAILRM